MVLISSFPLPHETQNSSKKQTSRNQVFVFPLQFLPQSIALMLLASMVLIVSSHQLQLRGYPLHLEFYKINHTEENPLVYHSPEKVTRLNLLDSSLKE